MSGKLRAMPLYRSGIGSPGNAGTGEEALLGVVLGRCGRELCWYGGGDGVGEKILGVSGKNCSKSEEAFDLLLDERFVDLGELG